MNPRDLPPTSFIVVPAVRSDSESTLVSSTASAPTVSVNEPDSLWTPPVGALAAPPNLVLAHSETLKPADPVPTSPAPEMTPCGNLRMNASEIFSSASICTGQ